MPSDDPQRLVVNPGFGAFSIHEATARWMRERGCPLAAALTLPGETYDDGGRRDPDGLSSLSYPRDSSFRVCEHLIAAVEAGVASDLSIVEVPADIEWVITEYDGAETVREAHRVFPGGRQATGIAHSGDVDTRCTMETDDAE
jgi:hypothetical protein